MSKAIEINSCTECPFIRFDERKATDETYYFSCEKTGSEAEGTRGRGNNPLPDCPLPDYKTINE